MKYSLPTSAASFPARQMALAQSPHVTSSLLTGSRGYHWEQLQYCQFGLLHRKLVKLQNWQINIKITIIYFIIIENKYVLYLQPIQIEDC